jgi:hypothetical protein
MYQHDSSDVFRFVLSGDLCGTAVQQLEWAWETAKSILNGKELIIDASGIAKADPLGLELLFRMRTAGARIIADLPPVSLELLAQLGVPALVPRPASGWFSRIWRRWSASGTHAGRTANSGSRSKLNLPA